MKAVSNFDVATARRDAADARQNADNFEKEAKLLADDLAAAYRVAACESLRGAGAT